MNLAQRAKGVGRPKNTQTQMVPFQTQEDRHKAVGCGICHGEFQSCLDQISSYPHTPFLEWECFVCAI